jgi:hypothetical protein
MANVSAYGRSSSNRACTAQNRPSVQTPQVHKRISSQGDKQTTKHTPHKRLANMSVLAKLQSIDWSFATFQSATGLYHIDAISNLHWYPGRCVPSLASTLISALARPGQLLLDPFVGSGTIAAAAVEAGLATIGMDINPIACLISRVKISLMPPDRLRPLANALTTSLVTAQRHIEAGCTASPALLPPSIPNGEENELWYHPGTLFELGTILSYINNIEHETFRTIAFVCFSSILRACSSQSNHWGYICDNMRPQSLVYKSALNIYLKRLQQYIVVLGDHFTAVTLRRSAADLRMIRRTSRIITASAATINQHVRDAAIDLIVTSPPYSGVNDYVDSQRLTLLWLPDGPEVRRISRCNETGARWKRFRKTATGEFITDMSDILHYLVRSLKPHGYLCLIYGDSPARTPAIPALISALRINNCAHIGSFTRGIPSKRALIPKVMNETIHVFRKL